LVAIGGIQTHAEDGGDCRGRFLLARPTRHGQTSVEVVGGFSVRRYGRTSLVF
jgi:hypothetical protein